MKKNQKPASQSAEASSGINLEIQFPGTENTLENQTAFLVELGQSINQAIMFAGDDLDRRSISNLTFLNTALQRKISINVSEMSDRIFQLKTPETN